MGSTSAAAIATQGSAASANNGSIMKSPRNMPTTPPTIPSVLNSYQKTSVSLDGYLFGRLLPPINPATPPKAILTIESDKLIRFSWAGVSSYFATGDNHTSMPMPTTIRPVRTVIPKPVVKSVSQPLFLGFYPAWRRVRLSLLLERGHRT